MATEVKEFATGILNQLHAVMNEPAYQHEDEDWLTGLIIAEQIVYEELNKQLKNNS